MLQWKMDNIFSFAILESRKDRDSRGGGIITYHKSCVNLTRRLDLEHEHVESMWYELKTKLHNILINDIKK
jgi:hypothetical protein